MCGYSAPHTLRYDTPVVEMSLEKKNTIRSTSHKCHIKGEFIFFKEFHLLSGKNKISQFLKAMKIKDLEIIKK